jgi:hypothetical protein
MTTKVFTRIGEIVMFDALTLNNLIIAAVLAGVVTWGILKTIDIVKVFTTGSVEMNYKKRDLELVVEKCYDLFPEEMLPFNGEIIRRGMKIRIITHQNKVFEGKFLGFNSDDMLCLMTNRFIIAHALTNIDDIEKI